MTFPGVDDVTVKLTGVISRAPKSSGTIVLYVSAQKEFSDRVVDKKRFIEQDTCEFYRWADEKCHTLRTYWATVL